MLKFQAQVYRINDVAGWNDRRELRLAPEFQRRRVWSPRGKSFLIDSIIRGMPLPQFFIREIVLPREKRTVREVVDGQQRLTTILGFIAGDFYILPMHNKDFARLKYEDLPEAVQKEFLSFPLSVNILEGTEDPDVLESPRSLRGLEPGREPRTRYVHGLFAGGTDRATRAELRRRLTESA